MSLLWTPLHGSSFLPLFGWTLYYARQHCLSHCMNLLGNAFIALENTPAFAVLLPQHTREENLLENSCWIIHAPSHLLEMVASIAEEKQSLIQLCKTDNHTQDFCTSCAKLLWVLQKTQATLITVTSQRLCTNSCMYASSFPSPSSSDYFHSSAWLQHLCKCQVLLFNECFLLMLGLLSSTAGTNSTNITIFNVTIQL